MMVMPVVMVMVMVPAPPIPTAATAADLSQLLRRQLLKLLPGQGQLLRPP
jgi:hypothetical protein